LDGPNESDPWTACETQPRENDGLAYPFRPRSWEELDEESSSIAATHPDFGHMSAVVKSVLHARAEHDLAAFTSMNDLMVRSTPLPEPPYDLVAVRAPNSVSRSQQGSF
jgi:hypothetical protein